MKKLKNIFVSTTFAKNNSKISDVLSLCKKEKIENIELGSNHVYENNFKGIVKKYNFRFIVHNYFPIPKKSFVVNIASSSDRIRSLSLQHVKKAINFCRQTNSKLYTFHPGFVSDPITASKSSKNYDFIWKKKDLNKNYKFAFKNMLNSLKKIIIFAKSKGVKIAIETEGYYKKSKLLLMQKPEEYQKLFKYFSPKELGINLNIGHLNLAAKVFNFSKLGFVKQLKPYILAIELSHNNGIEDQHLPLKKNAWYWKIINDPDFSDVYKILEFRNTNIKDIKKIFTFFQN
jgi:sugar phosphate isomerase/epimerase